MITQERTRHEVSDSRDVCNLARKGKIKSSEIIHYSNGHMELVTRLHNDQLYVIYQSSSGEMTEHSFYEIHKGFGVFNGRYIPGFESTNYKPSDQFDKDKIALQEAGIWRDKD